MDNATTGTICEQIHLSTITTHMFSSYICAINPLSIVLFVHHACKNVLNIYYADTK